MSSAGPVVGGEVNGNYPELLALTDAFGQLGTDRAQAVADIVEAIDSADPRTQAIFAASISGENGTTRIDRDPVVVDHRLTRFESAVSDSEDIVLVTPALSKRVGARVLSGEVEYYVAADGAPQLRASGVSLSPETVIKGGMFTKEDVAGSDSLHHPRQLLVGRQAIGAYLDVLGSRIVTQPKKEGDPMLIDKMGLGDAAEIKGLLDREGIDVAAMNPELIDTFNQYRQKGRDRVVRLLRQNLVQVIRDTPNKYSTDWNRKTEEELLFTRTLVIAEALDATDVVLPTVDAIDKFYAARAQDDTEPYLCFPKGMTNTEKWRQLELRDRLGRAIS